jgi:hypothetical protein
MVLRERAVERAAFNTNTESLARQVKDFERAAIEQCLLETGYNVTAALKQLQIPGRTLSKKMERLGINRRRLARRFQRKNSHAKTRVTAPAAVNGDPETERREERVASRSTA